MPSCNCVLCQSEHRLASVCQLYLQRGEGLQSVHKEFQVLGNRSTWPPCHGLVIHPNFQLKRNMKGRLRSTYFLNVMIHSIKLSVDAIVAFHISPCCMQGNLQDSCNTVFCARYYCLPHFAQLHGEIPTDVTSQHNFPRKELLPSTFRPIACKIPANVTSRQRFSLVIALSTFRLAPRRETCSSRDSSPTFAGFEQVTGVGLMSQVLPCKKQILFKKLINTKPYLVQGEMCLIFPHIRIYANYPILSYF